MNKLVVLWKTDSIIDIEELLVPYVLASKKNQWWEEINVIIWGGSQKLVSENEQVQAYIKKMLEVGIQVHACKNVLKIYVLSIIYQISVSMLCILGSC